MTINNNHHRRFGRTQEVTEQTVDPGALLATSYNEMLEGYRRHYSLTGDYSVKEVIDRAEHALALNQ